MKKKLLIIDGHAFAFRAYYAFQSTGLKNPKTGEPSGAVFGFFRMFFKLLFEFKPTHLVIPFDPGTPLERAKKYSAYKATRKPMPDDLRPQINRIKDLCNEFGITTISIDGQEADDIIAVLSKKYADSHTETYIFSSDKDLFQLLNEKVKMIKALKGVTDFMVIDDSWVKKELGVRPDQIPDYMGLVGDTSDNIPGVKGIGEKSASKLIQEFHNLQGIYDNIDEIKNIKIKSKLVESKSDAYLSSELATLNYGLHVNLELDRLSLDNFPDKNKIILFKQEGFNAIYNDLIKHYGNAVSDTFVSESNVTHYQPENAKYFCIKTKEGLSGLADRIDTSDLISLDTETTAIDSHTAELVGISISFQPHQGYYIPVGNPLAEYKDDVLPLEEIIGILKKPLERTSLKIIGQNIKYDRNVFFHHGIELNNISFDTMIASSLTSLTGRRNNLDDMAIDHLGYKTISFEELTGKGKQKKFFYEVDLKLQTNYASEDADITLQLYNLFSKKIENSTFFKLFYSIEIPLISVLSCMELEGICIDLNHFEKMSSDFEKQLIALENRIHVLAGKKFNITSTKELQEILFTDLKLPATKKTKTGSSTDQDVLESLIDSHPIIEELMEFRKISKLKTTYVDIFPNLVNKKTGKIHTSYSQIIASTGRLTSSDPNLQNIPVRDESGKMIRKGIIPAKLDYEILSLDYSQIELRIMAHFAKDQELIECYKQNEDIHVRTASGIFGVNEKLVTKEMRDKAKVINFSVIYGVTPFGLAKNLKISQSEAKLFIESYFKTYPGVKIYMDTMIEFCEKNSYVETFFGRRRYFPEIHSSNFQIREAAKRGAINTPIQGTSAEMIKIAMVQVHELIQKRKMNSKMILQVHDELVFEVHPKEKQDFIKSAKEIMEKAIELIVPITVNIKSGKNWGEVY